ncbi:unnamed protein product [Dovyalis caffra]|uniref:HMA domain-containing protein n=1 Tax=Dovyalis caffra TaxID=77055 RepID=A0AAV1SSB4_9ROSI|nr:unnamed protein product [Dovyalis caffra]
MSTDATTSAPTPVPTPSTPSPPQTVCELQVDTQSPGWQKTLTKVLKSIEGLSFTIDASRGRARVSGTINPKKLLLILAKAGKHAELLWVHHANNHDKVQGYNTYTNTPMVYGNGYEYYYDYPYNNLYGGMNYYMDDPQQAYLYSLCQDYYPPLYHPPYSYYEQPAMYFPQAPPPVRNQRLQSYCNMM